jgi:hypothetical protein
VLGSIGEEFLAVIAQVGRSGRNSDDGAYDNPGTAPRAPTEDQVNR